jgi:hypothetical protein
VVPVDFPAGLSILSAVRWTRIMPKRKLRIVKRTKEIPVFGVCERCNAQFPANPCALDDFAKAQISIQEQFDSHTCKPMDSSQNALRIARESTEGK